MTRQTQSPEVTVYCKVPRSSHKRLRELAYNLGLNTAETLSYLIAVHDDPKKKVRAA